MIFCENLIIFVFEYYFPRSPSQIVRRSSSPLDEFGGINNLKDQAKDSENARSGGAEICRAQENLPTVIKKNYGPKIQKFKNLLSLRKKSYFDSKPPKFLGCAS